MHHENEKHQLQQQLKRNEEVAEQFFDHLYLPEYDPNEDPRNIKLDLLNN